MTKVTFLFASLQLFALTMSIPLFGEVVGAPDDAVVVMRTIKLRTADCAKTYKTQFGFCEVPLPFANVIPAGPEPASIWGGQNLFVIGYHPFLGLGVLVKNGAGIPWASLEPDLEKAFQKLGGKLEIPMYMPKADLKLEKGDFFEDQLVDAKVAYVERTTSWTVDGCKKVFEISPDLKTGLCNLQRNYSGVNLETKGSYAIYDYVSVMLSVGPRGAEVSFDSRNGDEITWDKVEEFAKSTFDANPSFAIKTITHSMVNNETTKDALLGGTEFLTYKFDVKVDECRDNFNDFYHSCTVTTSEKGFVAAIEVTDKFTIIDGEISIVVSVGFDKRVRYASYKVEFQGSEIGKEEATELLKKHVDEINKKGNILKILAVR